MTTRERNDTAEASTAIVVGLIPSTKGRVERHETFASFDALAQRLAQHAIRETKEGPGWVPGDIPVGPRSKVLVTQWPVLALDVEGRAEGVAGTETKRLVGPPAPPVKVVADAVRARGWRACLATSWSHEEPAEEGSLGPRYRLVFAVSRPVRVTELEPLAEHVAALLGVAGALDRSGYDANRFFYLPSCPSVRSHLAERYDIAGEPLDVDALLAEANADADDAPADEVRRGDAHPSVIAAFNDAHDVGKLLEERGYLPKGPDRWLYPGSTGRGAGVVRLPKSQRVFSHHGNDPLRSERGHDAFSVWCTLDHGGDTRRAVREAAKRLGLEATRATPGVLEKEGEGAKGYTLLSAEDLEQRPPIEWRVKRVLPSRGFAQVFGPSRAGKSFLVFDLACAIAGGADLWFGYRVKQAPVVYVVLEGEAGITNRAEAWKRQRGQPLPEGLHFCMDQPFDVRKDVERLAATTPKGAVVFIDTQSRAAPDADENASGDMGLVLAGAKRLADSIEGLVVCVAHTGKDEERGVRGHSSQLGNADAQIKVTRKGASRTWSVEKSKDAADGAEHGFALEEVRLGEDEDGDPITSCVIVAEEGPPKERARPLGKNERLGIESYRRAAECFGQLDCAGGFVGLHVDDWRSAFFEAATCDEESKRGTFRRAREQLVERGLLTVRNNVYRRAGELADFDEARFAEALRARGTRNTSGTNAEQCSTSQLEEPEHTEHDPTGSVPCSAEATKRTRAKKPKKTHLRTNAEPRSRDDEAREDDAEACARPERTGKEQGARVDEVAAGRKRKPARKATRKR
jgi:hypothetical protein